MTALPSLYPTRPCHPSPWLCLHFHIRCLQATPADLNRVQWENKGDGKASLCVRDLQARQMRLALQ